MDTSLIGETAAKLMDGLGDREGEVVAVAIVTVVDEEDEHTYTRAEFSSERFYEQLGLLTAGLEVARGGVAADEDDD